MSLATELVGISLISGLLFVALHYVPWPQIRSQPLRPPWTYGCGTIGLSACYALLLLYWQASGRMYEPWIYLLAWCVVVATGGGAVIGGYRIDARLERKAQAKDKEAREEMEARWGGEQQKGKMEQGDL